MNTCKINFKKEDKFEEVFIEVEQKMITNKETEENRIFRRPIQKV